MGEKYDTTHPCFKPCWVTGEKESRLGYVAHLDYPQSIVYLPEIGLIEVANKRLNLLLGETHWKFRNFVKDNIYIRNW